MKRSPLILFLLLCASANVLAQENLPNSLLWRIKSKNGGKPSYLYGTIHLTDERVFNLGDSLYEAIRNTDGFATEVDANQLSAFAMEGVKEQMMNSKALKDLLNEKDLKKYGPQLAKKLHKSQEDIDSYDILQEKHKWASDRYRTGKMETFLDAYLFDIARRQNKWTGGIEDMEDQRSAMDNIIDKSDVQEVLFQDSAADRAVLEKMISIYTRQDLMALNRMSNADQDSIMVRRNLKMSRRIDSLSGVRTMMFAVGAAHLPGRMGLISLLKGRGFEVEPVFLSTRIKASEYKVKEIPRKWDPISDESGYYTAEMPGTPANIRMYGILEMKMYMDIFNSTAFYVMAVRSVIPLSKKDSLFDVLASKILKQTKKKDFQPLTRDGAHGRVYSTRDDDGYKKVYMLEKNGIIYVAAGIAIKEDEASLASVNRFLGSLKLLDVKTPTSLQLTAFEDSSKGFRIMLPGKPSVFEAPGQQKLEDRISRLWVTPDPVGGGYFFFGYAQMLPGRFIENDSSFLAGTMGAMKGRMTKAEFDSSWKEGNYRVGEIHGSMDEAQARLYSRTIVRGNRMYTLMAMVPFSSSGKNGLTVDAFFKGFSMLEPHDRPWSTTVSNDNFFSSWLPGPIGTLPKTEDESGNIERKFNVHDSVRVIDYTVLEMHFNRQFWSNSDSLFWESRMRRYVNRLDTILYKKKVDNGGAQGMELIKAAKGSGVYQRYRLLLNGDKIYMLMCSSTLEDVTSKDADRFFTDFRFVGTPKPTTLFQSRARILLDDLFNKDSATEADARSFLTYAPFTKADLPDLHATLLRIRGDSIPQDGHDPSYVLTNRIIELNDSSSFEFAMKHYKDDAFRGHQDEFLKIMASTQTLDHYQRLGRLLRESPPAKEMKYPILNKLEDSLSLLKQIMPDLLPLLKDTTSGIYIASLTSTLADSGLLETATLNTWHDDIVLVGTRRAQFLKGKKNSYEGDYGIIGLLARLNTPKANACLKKFLAVDNSYIRLETIEALLKNGQSVDTATVRKLAADKESRISLYRRLEKLKALKLMPVVYRSQKMIGEGMVYDYLEDEDFSLESLVYVGEKPSGGMKYLFYKIKTESEGDFYLVAVGPFNAANGPLDIEKLSVKTDSDAFLASKLAERENELINQLKDN